MLHRFLIFNTKLEIKREYLIELKFNQISLTEVGTGQGNPDRTEDDIH
jgi:hypothetical protein